MAKHLRPENHSHMGLLNINSATSAFSVLKAPGW